MHSSHTSANIDSFRFRGLHPLVLIGTASDRYAGWMGTIYSPQRYANRITRRSHRVGNKSFVEEVLPVDSVEEFFQHFSVLEIDYTFYHMLLQPDGNPSQTYHVLKNYYSYLHEGDRLLLKVPQTITARKMRHGLQYKHNPSYLNPALFTDLFYKPANDLLGATLSGFIFEQEYQRQQDRLPSEAVAAALDNFFAAIPSDSRYHVELRTSEYLTPALFNVFERHGIGQVLSHWTWLPSLQQQFRQAGRRFFNRKKESIIRLLTPRGVRYEHAYAMAHPFAAVIEGMMQPSMIEETASIAHECAQQGIVVQIIINNRAGGNAPLLAQYLARQFLAMQRSSPRQP